jgi:predicted enzyme involved in methoxymalonyl-ACP biosynthesis
MEGLINSIIHPHLDAAFLSIRLKYCATEENKTICSFYPLCSSGLTIIDCAFLLRKRIKNRANFGASCIY